MIIMWEKNIFTLYIVFQLVSTTGKSKIRLPTLLMYLGSPHKKDNYFKLNIFILFL